MVVIPCCFCSPDPAGLKYEHYYGQSLMQYKRLCGVYDDIYRLQQHSESDSEEHNATEVPTSIHVHLFASL